MSSVQQGCVGNVAPHVGAWIEMVPSFFVDSAKVVAPHVGAWIEILMKERFRAKAESHPTWVRGLK